MRFVVCQSFNTCGLFSVSHNDKLPRSIGQLTRAFRVRELHLSFAQGRWIYERWGFPLSSAAPSGVEFWAVLEAGNEYVPVLQVQSTQGDGF
jgi:hypothetical protein